MDKRTRFGFASGILAIASIATYLSVYHSLAFLPVTLSCVCAVKSDPSKAYTHKSLNTVNGLLQTWTWVLWIAPIVICVFGRILTEYPSIDYGIITFLFCLALYYLGILVRVIILAGIEDRQRYRTPGD